LSRKANFAKVTYLSAKRAKKFANPFYNHKKGAILYKITCVFPEAGNEERKILRSFGLSC